MSKTVQWKRGNSVVNSTYVGAQGEITINTDNWNLHVHDGLTPGGYVIDSSNGGASFGNMIVTGNITTGNLAVDNLLDTNVLIATGNVTASYFIGNGSLLTGITSYSNSNVLSLGEVGWAGNIIPASNAVYSLGSPTNQWANLYVADNTIYIGNIALGITESNILTVNNQQILSNNSSTSINTDGNITAGNLSAYRITTSFANVEGDLTTNGNITADYFIGNGEFLTGLPAGYANSNVASYGEVGWAGNIIPNANAVYTLGNITNQWANLWVANNTIYLGGVALGISESNVLTVNGQPTLTNNSNISISTSGDITTGNLSATNLTVSAIHNDAVLQITSNNSITLDNSQNSNSADINLLSGDDVIIRGKDKTTSDSEGGDIIIEAGDGGNADEGDAGGGGGDITIQAGRGGANSPQYSGGSGGTAYLYGGTGADAGSGRNARSGGEVRVIAGSAGYNGGDISAGAEGADVTIGAGNSTLEDTNGGDVNLIPGLGGDNAYSGQVRIQIASSSLGPGGNWVFLGSGLQLNLPQNAELYNTSVGNVLLGTVGNTIIRSSDSGNVSAYNFIFDDTGNLRIPGNINYANGESIFNSITSANIILNRLTGQTANNSGYLQWTGNSSGDGLGFTTLELLPDDTLTSQSLVIDPTAPGHVHLRTPGIGGNIEQPSANIFLGPENTNFEITAQYDVSPEARIHSGSYTWRFRNDAWFNLPGGIYSDNTIEIQTPEDYNPNVDGNILLYGGKRVDIVTNNLGSAKTWQFGLDGNLTLPSNSSNINYANGTSILTGITGGTSYTDSNVVNLLAAFGSNTIVTTGNITGGNIVGNITITGNVTGTSSNVELVAGAYTWTFNNAGNLVLPANTFAINYANGAVVSLGSGGAGNYGDSNVVTLLASFGSNSIVTTGNANVGNIVIKGNTTTGVNAAIIGVTNTLLTNTISSFSSNVNGYSQVTLQNKNNGLDATADYIITADNGSDTVNYADFGIINSGYDNATPTNSLGNIVYAADTYLYAQGNTSATSQSGGNLVIGTTTSTKTVKIFAGGANVNSLIANISSTGVAVTGNVSVSGNVTGTTPNVNLVAGSYTYTFDNTGNVTINGTGIKMPSRPASRVYGSSSNNIVNGTTLTSTNFTVDYNQGNHLNAGTGIFTAPVAGLYQTTLVARIGNNNGLNQVAVVKNNGSLTGANVICFWETDTNTGTASHFGTSGVANLVAGDTLRVKVVAGNIQFDSNDSWTVTYIG